MRYFTATIKDYWKFLEVFATLDLATDHQVQGTEKLKTPPTSFC